MSVIERIRERKRRKKIKDLCSYCRWYYPESGVCQIKKCCGYGYGYVTRRDREHCPGYEPQKVKETEDLTLRKIRKGEGLDPLPSDRNQIEEGLFREGHDHRRTPGST